jgi:putative component of toxin-antitoxin plasmid stabilization module
VRKHNNNWRTKNKKWYAHKREKWKKKKQRIIHSIWIVESGRLKEIKPWGGGAYQREIASPRGERYYFLEDKKRALVIIVVREREREREEMWKS